MRGWIASIALALCLFAAPRSALHAAPAQDARVVDRIAARIEGDIILQSQVRELSAFQQLLEGRSESDGQLLQELIEQWIVQTEASASRFQQPAQSEVDRELARIKTQFAPDAKYQARLQELGLSDDQVRETLTREIYVERYVDYKFRPSVQVDQTAVDAYYKDELLPALVKRNEPAPPRAQVENDIREVLVQRGISDLTTKWLEDTKSRLKIEIEALPVNKP